MRHSEKSLFETISPNDLLLMLGLNAKLWDPNAHVGVQDKSSAMQSDVLSCFGIDDRNQDLLNFYDLNQLHTSHSKHLGDHHNTSTSHLEHMQTVGAHTQITDINTEQHKLPHRRWPADTNFSLVDTIWGDTAFHTSPAAFQAAVVLQSSKIPTPISYYNTNHDLSVKGPLINRPDVIWSPGYQQWRCHTGIVLKFSNQNIHLPLHSWTKQSSTPNRAVLWAQHTWQPPNSFTSKQVFQMPAYNVAVAKRTSHRTISVLGQ